MHARNFDQGIERRDENKAYTSGNPFSLLKLQRIRLDPVATREDANKALNAAIELGIDACKCGVGIDLKRKVVKPLVDASKALLSED